MAGAELKVLSTERSVVGTRGAKCQSTEQSVDRARRVKYRTWCAPETEQSKSGTGCKTPGAEQSAKGEEH